MILSQEPCYAYFSPQFLVFGLWSSMPILPSSSGQTGRNCSRPLLNCLDLDLLYQSMLDFCHLFLFPLKRGILSNELLVKHVLGSCIKSCIFHRKQFAIQLKPLLSSNRSQLRLQQ